MSSIDVKPEDLRASAQVVSDVGAELRPFSDRAVRDAGDAAASTAGWSVSGGLSQISDSWRTALTGLHALLEANADGLRTNADDYEGTERREASRFRMVM
ncbi:WXG100 family type VII secretion target [Kitasatospora sp. NPDC096147]|uniref:WXG100 family type VII secretion target n=1 Tax=Kitasatospora sp. NPDC096147 TaxID=3364093 RepID=UPI003812C847